MKIRAIGLLTILVISKGLAWYPDYTVMVTDFVLPYDFLAPNRIPSIGLQAIGPHFLNIYQNPVDNSFQNPAYVNFVSGHYFYLDVEGEENQVGQNREYRDYPMINYTADYYFPSYWSPYRFVKEPKAAEPVARMIYFGHPFSKLPLGVGMTLEYFYDRQKFYQPYWYWGAWNYRDALGVAYDESTVDPYQDYREVEAGDNLQTERGYSGNLFLSFPVTRGLSLGLRYGNQVKSADGDYSDMDLRDENQWADDYLSYNDYVKSKRQNYYLNDLSIGVLLSKSDKSKIGVTIGLADGNIERDYLERDSTKNSSRYFYDPDTNKYSYYRRSGAAQTDKNWDYDGNTVYGDVHGDFIINSDVTVRFSIYSEERKADLTESETMWRRSSHESHYWADWDSTWRNYESISRASLERTGSGEYRFERQRISFGADWRLAPHIRFIGGIVVDKKKDHKDANEPFSGEKYSYHYHDYYEESTREYLHQDDKRFKWYRNEKYLTFAVPTGVIVNIGDYFEFQIGLTKIIKSTDIEEGYDLIVYHDIDIKKLNGTVIESADSNYVEGHRFPGVHDFISEYQMNAGISLKYKDVFKITVALRESILEPTIFKIGAEFTW